MKIGVVALSGGLDSTTALLKATRHWNYDVLAAHHVKLLTREGADRVEAEMRACSQIFYWFQSKGMQFALTTSEYQCLYDRTSKVNDIEMLIMPMLQALKAEVNKHEGVVRADLIWGDHDDEFVRKPFQYRWNLINKIFHDFWRTVHTGQAETPMLTSMVVPNRYNTKKDNYEYLPRDLRKLTTSCRKGSKCGNCDPCWEIEAIEATYDSQDTD